MSLSSSLCATGVVLMDISEVHRKVHIELEENVSAGYVFALARIVPENSCVT